MADNNPLIIEFNGLPGCGKSTLVNELNILISNMGITVYNLEENDVFIDKRKWIHNIFSLISNGGIGFVFYSVLFVLSVKPVKLSRLKLLKTLFLYYLSYINIENKADADSVVLVSQGYIQSIISICHVDEIGNFKYLEKLALCLNKRVENLFVINCDIPADISRQRILKRKSKQGRFDLMPENQMSGNLNIQAGNFNIIRKVFKSSGIHSIELNMQNEIRQNADIIITWLNSERMEKIES